MRGQVAWQRAVFCGLMPASLSAAPARPAYYPALTGVRAVAAYLVYFVHFIPLALHGTWVGYFMRQFYVGVGVFFVLSGFVIATRYQHSVQLRWAWWRRYLWRRFARIYPAYFLLNGQVLWALYWPIKAGMLGNTLLLVVLSQSLLRGLSSTLKFVGIPQAWSLTVEECFYLSAPLLLLAWQRWGRRGAVGFALAVVGLGLLLTAACQGRPALHGLFGSYHHLFNWTFFGRVLEFMLGVGLARWWHGRPAASGAPGWPWRTMGGVVFGIAVLAALAGIRATSTAAEWSDWYDGLLQPSAIALNIVVFPVAVVLVLAGLLAERSWLRALLASPLLQMLGRSSYFFYLVHVGWLSTWWQNRFGWERHVLWQFLATVLVAELGYRLAEEPIRRWLLK